MRSTNDNEVIEISVLLSENENSYTIDSKENNDAIEKEMRDALANGEFKVYLQPKINMVTTKLYGAEALSRWEHPVDGIRPPMSYIPLFERNGFIVDLDMYVFEEVCKLKAQWKAKKRSYCNIPISVNMSRVHIYNDELINNLAGIADKYGIPRNELDIEITESIFMKDAKRLIEIINRFKESGFLVSIDDFGSGFSALNMLKDIYADTIKIDRDFLKMTNSERGKKVLKYVISMCRDLKFDVVTEGIETAEQINFITSCGCQIAQGFYYSRPIPVSEFELFSAEYMTESLESYRFRFNGTTKSEDGSMEAILHGEDLTYTQGIFKDSKAMHFPGGDVNINTVHIPEQTIVNDSFTVSMWIKPERLIEWAAAIYIKFETGFCSIVPMTSKGESTLRIRDSREIKGWYDATADILPVDKWTNYAFTYNAKTEILDVYNNGEIIITLENIPTNRFVKWIILGGDIFQPSFEGDICELVIYNEAKDYGFMNKLYLSYAEDDRFVH